MGQQKDVTHPTPTMKRNLTHHSSSSNHSNHSSDI